MVYCISAEARLTGPAENIAAAKTMVANYRFERPTRRYTGPHASKEPVLYFVAGSDNKTRRSLVEGRELLATSLTPADILYLAYQHGMNMPAMVVEKALPGQRGLLVRTNLTK